MAGDQLGTSVARSTGPSSRSGRAYRTAAGDTGAVAVFDGGVTVAVLVELAAGDGEAGDRFGFSVAVQAPASSSAPTARADGGDQHSGIPVRSRRHHVEPDHELLASDLEVGDQFGYDVAIAGRVAVGSPRRRSRNNAGAAYVFGP
ncbi:MAG: hypothetical protein R2713_02610 [Ilumatobacteraceae bacterium]